MVLDSHLEIQPPWLISYACLYERISTPRRVPTRSAAAGGPSTTIVAIRKLQIVLRHGKSGIARMYVGTRCNPVKAASKGHSPTAGRCSNVVLSSPAKIPWLASFCHRFRPPHRIQDKAAHGCPYLLWYWSSATQAVVQLLFCTAAEPDHSRHRRRTRCRVVLSSSKQKRIAELSDED